KRKEYSKDTGRYRRGIGVASSWRGCSFGGEGYDWGSAILTMLKDGTVSISCGIVETGQGAKAVMAQIAAEVLGLTPDKVNYIDLETTVTPDILTTSASRGTMIGGSSVKIAAEKLRKRLFEHAAGLLGASAGDLVSGDNFVWVRGQPEKRVSFKELAGAVFWSQDRMTELSWYRPPSISWDPKTGKGSTYFTFHWMAQVFEVTVDTETGRVTVDHVYAVHDPGRVLNPDMARGQIIGAISWGIGFGLFEEVVVEDGLFRTHNLDTYRLLRASEMPPVTLEFLGVPDPNGPFGAKSVGEPGLDLPGAAIANAIANATKYRPTRLPVTPERLLAGLKEVSE
ncbi:MAG: xanthine dehydrogenase family protein molybdopterin-binding subunit, partial [Candidatus Ranarchaeia archaeon]